MGSKLAPIMAGFAMNAIEKKLKMPKLYLRYVDDCLAIFNDLKEVNEFFENLNSIDPDIKFTREDSANKALNFLDMTITLKDNQIETNWYIQPTNTGLYIHKLSFCPDNYKKNAITGLY